MIDRRNFFRNFWKPMQRRHRSEEDRDARVKALEQHVRGNLLPRDFDLTPNEDALLMSRVRSALEASSDTTLFSPAIIGRMESLVREVTEPWREAVEAQIAGGGGVQLVREAALGCARAFLNDIPTETIERLKARFGVDRLEDIEEPVEREIAAWLDAMDEATLREHNVPSIREHVFARLRTWC